MGKSVQVHKSHKTRFASKASRHIHRTSQTDKARISKEQKQHIGGKGARAARIQRNKMARDHKRAASLKEKRALGGLSSPPRVILLFGISDKVNLKPLEEELVKLLVPEGSDHASTAISSPDYKLRITILIAPWGDLLACMEMIKVADLIAFVAPGSSVYEISESGGFIDSFGGQCFSIMRTIGFPSTAVLIRDLPFDLKRRQEAKKACIACLSSELPEDCKFYPADTKDDLHKFLRLFKEQHVTSPHWRQYRPYLLSQEVLVVHDNDINGQCNLLLSGYVRAHSFSVNHLVHVSGAGDFQLSRIDVLKDPFPLNPRKNSDCMVSDDCHREVVLHSLLSNPLKLDPLVVENLPDPLAGEQTWPTEAEMAEADNLNERRKLKKKILPQGTSDYQAAWIVDDTDEEDSNVDEYDGGDRMVLDDGNNECLGQHGSDHSDIEEEFNTTRDIDADTETDTVMGDDDNLTAEQIKAEIERIKNAHADDEEFPDEVDTPLDIPARRRFAKFRGLKSFRTSSWDPKESLPQDYAKIFAFDNFTRTQKHALAKVAETDDSNSDESAPVGSYVRLHVKQVSVEVANRICSLSKRLPITVSGLLQHESKMSVLHFSIKKHDSYNAPIKSKESLIFHVGFRRFFARPLFSSATLNSDKHKMERFLHPGRFSIASIYSPISFPPVPLVVLSQECPRVAATGSLRSVDPDRIILKKIILTGYPQRVSKLKAAVRFMFHNPEDVRWFKPVDLWTKCGRHGRVKEPVGTHGAMKCVFNGVVQQHDTVCMSLYKRAYPKWLENQYELLE